MQPPDSSWLPALIGQYRYRYVLRAAGNDHRLAVALHERDMRLRDALRPELEYAEVMLRNCCNVTLERLHQGQAHWLCDSALPVLKILEKRRDSVLLNLQRGEISPEQAVNRLPFGFWQQLTASRLEKTLWVPLLHQAFAPKTDRAALHRAVARTVRLRNRVHHYEPVFDQPLKRHLDDIFWLFDIGCPPLGAARRIASTLPGLIDHSDGSE